jgi:CBS domain containing-hemolysin-like protein
MMSLGLTIFIIVICLLVEGFFSGTEMAIVNAEKYRLAIRTDSGSRLALAALHMVKHPARFFSTTLLGTNLATVTGSVVLTLYIISRYGEAYAPLAILYWPFTLIFGEMVPKSIYQYYANQIVLKVAPVLFIISIVLAPVIWPLTKLTDLLLGGVKKRLGAEPPLTREELELMIETGTESMSDMKPAERTMISRIFDLAEKKVANIMTPLVDIVSVPVDASREDASQIMEQSGYSRMPVFQGRVVNIVGTIVGTDLLFSDEETPMKALIRPAYYVPEDMPLDELLLTMKRRGQPLTVVVDEFGGATGIVTTEDLLEEVVGEIRDEHDIVAPLYQRIGHHHYLVSGRMEIEEANERLKLGIPHGDYETIAGFLLKKLEKIPKIGDSIMMGDHVYSVRRANERAILEVEIIEVRRERTDSSL